jgi:hypothetical protein
LPLCTLYFHVAIVFHQVQCIHICANNKVFCISFHSTLFYSISFRCIQFRFCHNIFFFCLESVLIDFPIRDDHCKFTFTTSFILQRTKTCSLYLGGLHHPFDYGSATRPFTQPSPTGTLKEVIRPQVPLRPPCYDFSLVADPRFDSTKKTLPRQKPTSMKRRAVCARSRDVFTARW